MKRSHPSFSTNPVIRYIASFCLIACGSALCLAAALGVNAAGQVSLIVGGLLMAKLGFSGLCPCSNSFGAAAERVLIALIDRWNG